MAQQRTFSAAAMASTMLMMAVLPGAFAALPSSSPIVQWVNLLQSNIRSVPNIQNQVGSKIYALHAVAVYNAVKANRGNVKDGSPKWNESAVIAYASHTLLTHIFPWWFYKHDLLIQAQLAGLDSAQLDGAQKLGEAQANAVLASRIGDGFARWARFKPAQQNTSATIGKYQFLPNQTYALYPQYGASKPILLSRAEVDAIVDKYKQRFKGYFQSDEYYSDLNYTRTVGGAQSTARTAYDNDTPLFWAGTPGTALIHGQFINISYAVLPADYSLYDQARFFALLGTAINDASQACYKTKYETLFWRPTTAINFGDGSNKYTPDPTWVSFLATPPHPSYPSGHQCLSQPAVSTIVYALGGNSKVSFSVGSESIPGQLRNFTDVKDVLKETTISRIYGGMHFRRDNTDGLDLGQDGFDLVLKKFH